METPVHDLTALFQQLGLPATPAARAAFVAANAPLPEGVALADAPFWSPAQATFLREECQEDADWAGVVDQLNLLLRAPR